MILDYLSYEWLDWGVSRVRTGDLPPDVLARIDADRQRARALTVIARKIPMHWTPDRSVRARSIGCYMQSAWRRFAELRFDTQRVYVEAIGGFGYGPGFVFKDVRIYLDGAIVGRAWTGGCSLGFSFGGGPAVAMLRDDLALRVNLARGISRGRDDLELLGLTRGRWAVAIRRHATSRWARKVYEIIER